ncbi:MAG: hypothetical protein PHD74_05090 [Candidatus Krumholzibacteria bacterium]|nr:hypothetical protein [Candidatus Krumholzibacteria bacterium]
MTLVMCCLLFPINAAACGYNYPCDPCLLVYPTYWTTYHYNPTQYYTVKAGDPGYNATYDRGGDVLIADMQQGPDRIAYEIYRAPNLAGFQKASGYTGYYFTGTSFDIVIDGWSNFPATREDLTLIFEPIPSGCTPTIIVDGASVTGPPYTVSIGDLVVSTPVVTPSRTYYSNTMTKSVSWSGCIGLYIYAFEDCDHDRHWLACGECEEEDNCCFRCHQLCASGAVVPVENETWGSIKSLFK